MTDFQNTQQALSDIRILKQAIAQSRNKLALTVDSVDTHLMLNIGALAVAASIAAGVIILPEITEDMHLLATMPESRLPALSIVGGGLAALLGTAYGYIYLHARKEKTAFADFSDKYFSYFKNMSALSDIAVKFVAASLVVMAGRPEWIAPLFIFFIGDLVLQGRLLILSPRTSLALGVASFAAGIAALCLGVDSLLAPAAAATVACGWSVANIFRFRRRLFAAQE